MPPRGNRLACMLRSLDGCNASYDVVPGEQPNSIARVEPAKWDKPPQKAVQQATFTIIGEFGMTGQVIVLDAQQWEMLQAAKLEQFFYAAILWGKSPFKVVEDAKMLLRRSK
jgi:hypothetical protein